MNSAMKVFFSMLLGMTLSNCSLFSKSTPEETKEDVPQYDNYSSSGVYDDIQGEADENRKVSSEDYSDDDYGNVEEEGDSSEGSSDDELMLSGADEEPAEDSGTMSAPGTDPLPVYEEEEEVAAAVVEPVKKAKRKKTARKKPASVSKKFKNGMYAMSANCNMRKKPSAKSAKAGKVTKGKKLWVEGHNSKWVKVYKKSGAVYVSKHCL